MWRIVAAAPSYVAINTSDAVLSSACRDAATPSHPNCEA